MVSRRYSGYLADDESLRRPQVRCSSPRRTPTDWRSVLRPPSRCLERDTTSSVSAFSAPTHRSECRSRRGSRERRPTANEFAEFVDFLADEEVLDSLQDIVEDAVRKLCRVTNEKGEHVFAFHEDSCSSPDSTSWSFSYSHTRDSSSARTPSKYTTTTFTTTASSSSDEDWDLHWEDEERPLSRHRVCLLDKYAARQERAQRQTSEDRISEEYRTEVISGRTGDEYFYCAEHFHAWARLAETFRLLQGPKKDYFSKFQKSPKQTFSAESLHKEITNVLKRPTSSSLLLYHPGQQPFEALDFLEENKILSGLQDIINQAVHKVLEVTSMTEGLPMLNIFDEQGYPMGWESSEEEEEEEEEEIEGLSEEVSEEGEFDEGSEEGEEDEEGEEGEEGSDVGGSGEESGDDDETADGKKKKKKKRKKKKGKYKKKKGVLETEEEEKGKKKYSPPTLSKSKQKGGSPEEPRKQKYIPPPLPKTKGKTPHEETAHKPKYVAPPLPRPRYKKPPEMAPGETETPEKKMPLAKQIMSPKDLKRARLEARPAPKQAIIDFLIENAAKLILYKYNYETLLSEKLGMISVPVTKVLLEIMFGYKRIKGSGIRLSSQIDWSKVYEEIYAPRPQTPKTPKHKGDDKKKAGAKKKISDKKLGDKALIAGKVAKPTEKKRPMKPRTQIPGSKVVIVKTQVTPAVTKSQSTPVPTRLQPTAVSTKSQLTPASTKSQLSAASTKSQLSAASTKSQLPMASTKSQLPTASTKSQLPTASTKSQIIPSGTTASTKSQIISSGPKMQVPPPVTKTQVRSQVRTEVTSKKPERKVVVPDQEVSSGPEIIEIVPPQFHEDVSEFPEQGDSFEEGDSEMQTSSPKESDIQALSPKESLIQASVTKGTITPTEDTIKSSTKADSGPHGSEEALPNIPSKQASKQSVQKQPSLKMLIPPQGSKGSLSSLPEVEPAAQSSGELLKKSSSSRRSSFAGEVKKSSTTLPKI